MKVFEIQGRFVPARLATLLSAAGVDCHGVSATTDSSGATTAVQVMCGDTATLAAVSAVTSSYDSAVDAANLAAQQAAATNQATIATAIANRLAAIRTARTALAGGNIFSALSANERAVIDGLLQDDLYLGRIALNLYDGTA